MGEFEQCEGAQIECPIPSQLNRCLGRAAFLVNSTSLGELLPSRDRQQSVPGARQLHSYAVAPVVARQAQGQATQGRELSTLAPLRALWTRTSDPAWARRAVGEGVRSCPRAGCGKSARPVR